MRDLTQGRLRDHMTHLVPAAVAGYLLLIGFELVDTFWVGRMPGASANLAALAVGTYALWALYSLGSMVEHGVLALVARHVGAKNRHLARLTAGRGLAFALVVWLVAVAVTLPLVPSLVDATRIEAVARGAATDYLRLLVVGSLPIVLFAAVDAVFRAWGDTRTPMWLLLVALLANGVLDPWFIRGGFGLPAGGLEGAAWATVLTRGGAAAAGVLVLWRRGHLAWKSAPRFDTPAVLGQMARIGAPSGLAGVLYCGTFLWMTRLLADHGSDAIGAFMVGQKAESVSWASLVGLSAVTSAWVGQNLGAGNVDRARRGAWAACGCGVAVGIACSVLFLAIPEFLVGLFAPDEPGVLHHGRQYLRIIAVSQLFLAAEIILQAAFAGAGDTVPPMLVIAPLTLARIPIAMALDAWFDAGVAGVFWSATLSTMLKGVFLALWFRRGTWARRLGRSA